MGKCNCPRKSSDSTRFHERARHRVQVRLQSVRASRSARARGSPVPTSARVIAYKAASRASGRRVQRERKDQWRGGGKGVAVTSLPRTSDEIVQQAEQSHHADSLIRPG